MKAASDARNETADAMEHKAHKHKTPAGKGRWFRTLMRLCAFVLALVLLLGGLIYWYSSYTKTHYEITFYQETSKKVSRNIRLIVIADLHNREYGENNQTLIGDITALKPDVILFAGDMVNFKSDDYEASLRLVKALSDVAPCYGVMGNHENERVYLAADSALPERFEEAGLKLLRNASETIAVGADRLQLIGVEGTSYGFEEYGGRRFMEGVQIDPKAYSVVIAHIPVLFDEQLSKYDFDLGIAGHTHGGIVILPRLGGLYSAEEGLDPTYDSGRFTLSGGQTLLISRGLGDSSQIPRINNMPELMVIDINWC